MTTAHVDLHPNGSGEARDVRYEALSVLKLKPGRYHLRLSATSDVQARTGSLYYDLEVPDYSKEPLAMSSVAVSTTPAVKAAPREVLAGIVPVVPTTEREFGGEQASAFLRIYQGGKTPVRPVRLMIRIADAADRERFVSVEDLDTTRFGAARAADVRFAIPLDRLTSGGYVLSFEAAISGVPTVRKEVRFSTGERDR